MFELDQDIVKTNILSKFDEDWVKTVVARVVLNKNFFTHDGQGSQKLTLSFAQVN